MKKIEFAINMVLRATVLAFCIYELISAGDWGFIWWGIFYFSMAIIMIYSIIAQIIMLMRWKPSRSEYYQF